LRHVPKLLDFDDSRLLTLETLGNLALHHALPNIGEELLMRIKSLLRYSDFFSQKRR
jgi:hypothetical protein